MNKLQEKLDGIVMMYEQAIELARQEEREKCAKMVDEFDLPFIAGAIRKIGEVKTDDETCPHCGAEQIPSTSFIQYLCGTLKCTEGYFELHSRCYERQLYAKATEIERLRKALSLIYIYAKDDANSVYCSNTAFNALKEGK